MKTRTLLFAAALAALYFPPSAPAGEDEYQRGRDFGEALEGYNIPKMPSQRAPVPGTWQALPGEFEKAQAPVTLSQVEGVWQAVAFAEREGDALFNVKILHKKSDLGTLTINSKPFPAAQLAIPFKRSAVSERISAKGKALEFETVEARPIMAGTEFGHDRLRYECRLAGPDDLICQNDSYGVPYRSKVKDHAKPVLRVAYQRFVRLKDKKPENFAVPAPRGPSAEGGPAPDEEERLFAKSITASHRWIFVHIVTYWTGSSGHAVSFVEDKNTGKTYLHQHGKVFPVTVPEYDPDYEPPNPQLILQRKIKTALAQGEAGKFLALGIKPGAPVIYGVWDEDSRMEVPFTTIEEFQPAR